MTPFDRWCPWPENDYGEVELLILLGATIRWVVNVQGPAASLSSQPSSSWSVWFLNSYCSIFKYTIHNIQNTIHTAVASPSDFSILFYDYGAPYSDPTDFIHCKSILLKNKTLNWHHISYCSKQGHTMQALFRFNCSTIIRVVLKMSFAEI